MTYGLTLAETRAFFARVTYKDTWTFTVEADEYEGAKVWIGYSADNAYRPDRPFTAKIDTYLSPNDRQDTAALLRWIMWRLQRIESHEAREWLRVDGELVSDPHGASR